MNRRSHSANRRHRRAHRLRGVLAGLGLGLAGLALTQPTAPIPVRIPGATAAPASARAAADAAVGMDTSNAPGRAEDTASPGARDNAEKGGEADTSARKGAKQRARPEVEMTGDAALRGELDLARAKLEDGRYVVPLGKGRRAILTLDPAVQEAAEAALARAKAPRGAVVVMGVDGRILAVAGHRDGDRGAKPRFGKHLDLAMSVWAPAASVFKIVTGAALVAAGVRPESKVCYHGGLRSVEASNLVDDKARDSACGNLTDGIARSQNAIVAKLAHRHLKPGALRAMARSFGFGDPVSFALDVEPSRASIPGEALEFARVAAGFWHTELSPMGGALVANTVASGGRFVTPYIVEAVVQKDRRVVVAPAPARRVLARRVARDLAKMMTATTETGTAVKGFHDLARRKFLPRVPVAGKTGTLARAQPSFLEYSWFVGFAPSDEPEVSISVLLGNPPRWHLKAHTAARMVLQAVF